MKTRITFFFSAILYLNGFSQQSPNLISGTVKDTRNEEIPAATVRLLKAGDSVLVKAGATDVNGKFQFKEIPDGTYLLSIRAIGQKVYTSAALRLDAAHNRIDLPAIIMQSSDNINLAQVVISAKRPMIEQQIDKTVVNVESMISSAGSNTLEVLSKTPGVTVGPNGDVSLNGRGGVLVLIDGRSTYMSGQDLAAYLKSLPGGLLDKIELMDNPPARYDASGNAIINIRLKKNRDSGLTGNIATGYTQGRYARNNDALNLNYHSGKVNLFANTGYSNEKNYTDDTYDRRFFTGGNEPDSRISLLNRQQNNMNGLNVNLGMDYAASANTTYGFLVNLNRSKRNGRLDYNSTSYNAAYIPDSLGIGNTMEDEKRTNIGSDLNFTHKFGKAGRELSADVNYLNYHTGNSQVSQNFVRLPDGSLSGRTDFLYVLPSDINIYTVKADYVHPLPQEARLEAGFKSSLVNNNNIADYYNTTGGAQIIDNNRSNHFKYRENINAAYINSLKNWKRFSAQLGLRMENTQATGRQLGNEEVPGSSFTKDYTRLFPSVFASYKLDTLNANTLNLSLTRRIGRPNYQLMNPFQYFRDKYTYSAGNPSLDPQYQYRYELRFQHKQFLRMGLSYNHFTQAIFQITEAVGNVFISKPDNIASGFMVLLSTSISASPAPWWKLYGDVLLSRVGLSGQSAQQNLDFRANVARINLYNQLSFSQGWSAEAGAYYASRDFTGQTVTSGMFRANAGIQKKIWKDKASIRVSMDDIFHSWVYHNRSIDLKEAQYFQTTETDTRRIGLAFTWRFGNDTFARKRNHADNASDEEKSRVQ